MDLREGGRSAHQLVHEAGIDPQALSVASIAVVLAANPWLVDEWLRWSADQRATPADYFIGEQGHYVVGRAPGDERVVFTDRIAACAEFILRQVRAIG